MKKHLFLLTAGCLLFSANCMAQPGELDSDFSGDGRIIENFDTGLDKGTSIAVQPDGKIIVGGQSYIQGDYDFVLIRYNTDGSLDNSFSDDGKASVNFGVAYDDYAMAMALEDDGKITLAGYSDLNTVNTSVCLARLLPDGTLDQSFGINGKVFTDAGTDTDAGVGIAVNAEGKYAVCGQAQFNDYFIILYNNDGSLDATFGNNGILYVQGLSGNVYTIEDIAFQQNGKIVIGGTNGQNGYYNFFAARYNIDGTLDNTFSVNGMVDTDFNTTSDWASTIEISADGKILLAGFNFASGSENDIAVVRYNSDGTLDQSFNGSGKRSIDLGYDENINAMVLQPDGKILLGGENYNSTNSEKYFLLLRLNSDGSLDNSFGTNGVTYTTFINSTYHSLNDMALQPDLKIVVTGIVGTDLSAQKDIGTARYLSGLNLGVAEFSGAAAAPLIYPNPIHEIETLNYTLLNDEMLSIELYNTTGALVKTFVKNEKRVAGEHTETLHFPVELSAGNYLLQLNTAAGMQTIKIVR